MDYDDYSRNNAIMVNSLSHLNKIKLRLLTTLFSDCDTTSDKEYNDL